MKRIIDISASDARDFLLKEDSYFSYDLPSYFSFQEMLDKINAELIGKTPSDFRASNPREFEDTNYKLLNNKDGKYAWRPFQLINPFLYVSLVQSITNPDNWELIQTRFKEFGSNDKIECHSIPAVSEKEGTSDKESQIYTWWQLIEQRSIALAIEYRYMLQTDITDCYGSIYTHSIAWALHKKEEAKKRENRNNNSCIGNKIDGHLQDMSYGQTNGIPQGSKLMDFIAEIILGYVDEELSKKINEIKIVDYKILRYRDDYRVFSNNTFESEQITKVLSEILSGMGLKLNPDKTQGSDNVIKHSLKPDKRYWIANKRKAENKQKWLIQLYLLSEKFPNCGTLETQMRDFLSVMRSSTLKDPNLPTLISLVVEIAFRNPRVSPVAVGILTLLLKQIEDPKEKKNLVHKIKNKFDQVPNSALLEVWLQRLFIKVDDKIEYDNALCNKVKNSGIKLWNTEWLNQKFQKIIDSTPVVNYDEVKNLEEVLSVEEIENIIDASEYGY